MYLALVYQPLEDFSKGPNGDIAEPGEVSFVVIEIRFQGIHPFDQIRIHASLWIAQASCAFDPKNRLALVINQGLAPKLKCTEGRAPGSRSEASKNTLRFYGIFS